MPLPFSGRPRESPPRPNLSQPPLLLHRQPPSPTPRVPLFSPTDLPPSPPSIPLAYTTSPPLLSRRPSSISVVSPPRLHHEFPSSLPQAFLHLRRQPPSVFYPEGNPALGGDPPPPKPPPFHPPRFSLCATSSLSIISRGRKRSYLEPTHALGKSATITYVR